MTSNLRKGDEVLASGQWFAVERVDGDTVFVSDEDGGEHEFALSQVEQVNHNQWDDEMVFQREE